MKTGGIHGKIIKRRWRDRDSYTGGACRWYNRSVSPSSYASFALLISRRECVLSAFSPLRVYARNLRTYIRIYVYVHVRLLELRIRSLCSSSGKTSVGRQWEELSNADICLNVPRAPVIESEREREIETRPSISSGFFQDSCRKEPPDFFNCSNTHSHMHTRTGYPGADTRSFACRFI